MTITPPPQFLPDHYGNRLELCMTEQAKEYLAARWKPWKDPFKRENWEPTEGEKAAHNGDK